MKRIGIILFAITVFAASLSAATTVTVGATVIADYSNVPDFSQFMAKPFGDHSFKGIEWEVAFDRFGFGGTYAVDFSKDGLSNWWLDWYGQGMFLSYHFFGTGELLDPFVQAGIGCAGRVFTSNGVTNEPHLSISIFPSLTAGLAIDLQPLVVGAKLNWVPGITEIPCTSIPGYSLRGIQVALSLGYRLGDRE